MELIGAHNLDFMLSCHRRRAPRAKNPVRGELFVGESRPTPFFFLFFSGAGLARLLNCSPAAPLKNKKKKEGGGGAGAINRPPLAGFERVRNRSTNRDAQRMWVMTSAEAPGCCRDVRDRNSAEFPKGIGARGNWPPNEASS